MEEQAGPVVLLAFANDHDQHLDLLKVESRKVYEALRGHIEVLRDESTTLSDLANDLVHNKNRLAVFHYAGHANGTSLRLEPEPTSKAGAAGSGVGHAGGIASLLGAQKGLKLVFLNGCSTRPQVEALHSAGVPAVIATSVPIEDPSAMEFAVQFYEALATSHSIEEAFGIARGVHESKHGASGSVGVRLLRSLDTDPDSETEELPWGLYVHPSKGQRALAWKLGDPWPDLPPVSRSRLIAIAAGALVAIGGGVWGLTKAIPLVQQLLGL